MIIKEAYVAEVLTKDERANMINHINIASVLGLPLGPLAGYISSLVSITIYLSLNRSLMGTPLQDISNAFAASQCFSLH